MVANRVGFIRLALFLKAMAHRALRLDRQGCSQDSTISGPDKSTTKRLVN